MVLWKQLLLQRQETSEGEVCTKINQITQVNNNFQAGSISDHILAWKQITDNDFILDIVKNGYQIDFVKPPAQTLSFLHHQHFTCIERQHVQQEILKLVNLNVIAPVSPRQDQILSPIFLVGKKDGSKRMILNLKRLNGYVSYQHFKMESIQHARDLILKHCFLASIDLEKAYYAVPIHKAYRKYLRFSFNNVVYEYTCLPNGLSSAPWLFTKLLRVVFSYLRTTGLLSVVYLDDILLISPSYDGCKDNVQKTPETWFLY